MQKPKGLQAWLESRQALWPQAWNRLSLEDVTSRFLSDHAFRWQFGAQSERTEQFNSPRAWEGSGKLKPEGSGVRRPLGFQGASGFAGVQW